MANYQDLMTFQYLYDSILPKIKASCANVGDSYNSIDSPFIQDNYKVSKKVSANKHSITATATLVNSTKITQVVESTISTDFYNYIVTTKGINLAEKVTTNKLYYFLNCVVAFIQTKLRVAMTEDPKISNRRYTIYYTASTTYPDDSEFRQFESDAEYTVKPFDDLDVTYTVPAPEVIRASDANAILDVLNKVLNKNIKPYLVKYSYSQTYS